MRDERLEARLIAECAPLVRKIACRTKLRCPSAAYDDLVQDGMVGLLDAARRFEDDKGAKFTTYASTRIEGAIRDGLRGADVLSRESRKELRAVRAAGRALAQELGREPRSAEIAQRASLTLDRYHSLIREEHATHGNDVDGLLRSEEPVALDDPLGAILMEELARECSAKLMRLPPSERLVLLCQLGGGTLMEAAAQLGVTESRACQLRKSGTLRLRRALA